VAQPPAFKRMRLRGKVSGGPAPGVLDDLFGAGGLEAALEEALDNTMAAGTGTSSSAAGEVSAAKPAPGVEVQLKGLAKRPDLNGQKGTLSAFNKDTDRWVCLLTNGSKVNVKIDNFDVVTLTRPTAGAAQKRAVSASVAAGEEARRVRARGRGIGRGVGRGGAASRGKGLGRGAAPPRPVAEPVAMSQVSVAPAAGADAAALSESD